MTELEYKQFEVAMDYLNREYMRGWADLDDDLCDTIKRRRSEFEDKYPDYVRVYHYNLIKEAEEACGL